MKQQGQAQTACAANEGLEALRHKFSASYDPEADPLTNLLAALDVGVQFCGRDCHWDGSEEQICCLDEKLGRAAAHIRRILDEGIAQGHFRPMDTGRVALLHLGMCQGCAQTLLLTRHSFQQCRDASEDAQEVRKNFHELIAGSVRAHQAPTFANLTL